MTAYATVADVESGFRDLDTAEETRCSALIDEAGIIIDSYNDEASDEVKKVVTCRMVRRAIGDGDSSFQVPIGATQGSMSALGYQQSWTMSSGSTGELYLSKLEKHLLGLGDKIGSHSPLEDLDDD